MVFKYICNCKKQKNLYTKKNSYWENRNQTTDEQDISQELTKKNIKNKNILHIGIGNSKFGIFFSKNNKVCGISISQNEIDFAKKLSLKKYDIYFIDKYSINFQHLLSNGPFDYIIDANLKSYTCCQKSFNFMLDNIFKLLKKGGQLITSRKGMKWSKKLIPKLSFNLKNFFHFKLKEIDGDPQNQLDISELELFCKKKKIKLSFDNKLCYLEK